MNNVKVNTASSVKLKKRKSVSLDKKKAQSGWLFVLPFMILFGHHKVKVRELAGMVLAVAGVLLIALNGG